MAEQQGRLFFEGFDKTAGVLGELGGEASQVGQGAFLGRSLGRQVDFVVADREVVEEIFLGLERFERGGPEAVFVVVFIVGGEFWIRLGAIRQVGPVAAAGRLRLIAPISALAAIFVAMEAAFFRAGAACFHPLILP